MQKLEFNKPLKKHETPVPGLVIYDLAVLGDNRGWFKENWQREKMLALGLPDFGPVQNNFSFNGKRGTMRGIHAEPWDKFVSVGSGSFFGAWVDVREGSETYGQVFTAEIDASKAIFVPAGVANSYLTLEDNTVYSYLVNDHWYPDAQYTFVNATDPSLKINWPISTEEWEWSDKDKNHPMFSGITPVPPKKILVTGANGQVGRALRKVFPAAEFVTREAFDITDPKAYESRRWRDYQAVINTAAYNAVDAAETDRENCWRVNATAPKLMAKIAAEHNITLVHFGTDYEFDGSNAPHSDDESPSPLSVYASSKAAGVIAASTAPKHYVLRVSWVIGEGKNFVRTMQGLAEKGIKPSVVNDQIGRLSFADDIAAAVEHLLRTSAPHGIYNLSNEGIESTWAEIAKAVYELSGKSANDVTPVSTAEYYKDKAGIAPRPLQSMLLLDKIKATGFAPRDWREALKSYLATE
ncbi:MAG TPA: bifunctional dTDP-4-dehydrorhamnose 3,5-epimerase family protein/NAD(P)-dependent oxidoreductase [Candidatus Saccharimonadales bacterium]